MIPINLSSKVTQENLKSAILSSKYLSKKEWEDIEATMNILQNGFIRKLRLKYACLTEDDIHIILLLRIEMTHEEIIHVYDILLESFRKRRYRLKKKMNIQCNSFSNFIRNLKL